MAQANLETRFQRWVLTVPELAAAEVFSDLQVMQLQNLQADYVDQILNLKFDAINPHDYGLTKAYLQGQLDLVTFLLNTHKMRKEAIAEEIRNSLNSQG